MKDDKEPDFDFLEPKEGILREAPTAGGLILSMVRGIVKERESASGSY
jgi:hypothetical protein